MFTIDFEQRLLHCGCRRESLSGAPASSINPDTDFEVQPPVETTVADFNPSKLPADILLPLRVATEARVARKYLITAADQEIPTVIIDWMKDDVRYIPLFN